MEKLIVITSETNESIINQEKQYSSTNKPFTRQKLILEGLKKKFKDAQFVVRSDSSEKMEKRLANNYFLDKKYLSFLKNAYPSFITSKNYGSDEYLSPYDGGLVNYTFGYISHENLDKIPYYLQCGLYGNDFCTSIFPYTYKTALQSAYNGLLVEKLIENDENIIYCLNTFPGHHATYQSYSGYCFFNNAAICADSLLEKYDKIAILDLDYHHGDGTQKIFYESNSVLTVSIHADPTDNFPFYTGFQNEIGDHFAESYNCNYPIPVGTTFDKYQSVLTDALEQIVQFGPKITIISFGADTFENDPQGGFNLKLDDYVLMGNIIRKKLKGPIVITQEGGYYLEYVDKIVSNFIEGLVTVSD